MRMGFALAAKRIHGFVAGVCSVLRGGHFVPINYLQFDQSGGTVTQPLTVSGWFYADSISDWICLDVFDPTFIANLAGDAVRRGKEKDLRRVMSRRGLVLAGAAVTMTGFLGARLYYLQVAQTSRYQRLSDRNQFDVRVVPPARGRLFDHKMRLVAGNAESFELRITPLYARNLQIRSICLPRLLSCQRHT